MKSIFITLAALLVSFTLWANDPVNINEADAEEIAGKLKGIGLSKAELIVDYREANGAFLHVDELVNVKGIGVRTIDKNRGMIVLSNSEGGDSG